MVPVTRQGPWRITQGTESQLKARAQGMPRV